MKKSVDQKMLCVQPLPQTIVSCRDKDGNNSREQRAKNRDKRPEEDQNDNRDDQGNTKEVGTDTDT